MWAGAASECANEQGQFWAYHDYLFDHWQGENSGAFSKDKLKQYAVELKLDTAKFNECVDSGRMEKVVQQSVAFARQLGISSTPTFAINGKPVQGALPFEEFQKMIEQAQQSGK